MPPKKDIFKYPRYFRSVDPQFRDCVIVFPRFGSLGSAYYSKTRRWSAPQWRLSEMDDDPVDEDITEKCVNRLQAIAFGIPKTLPPFKAEQPEEL